MKVTVSVCTYRRFDVLGACLEHLLRQTVPASDFHLQIVDNSLQPEVSKIFRDSLPKSRNIEYLITEKAGIAYARNVALNTCNTEFLAFVDDDTEAHPDWLENLLAVIERSGAKTGAVGGRVDPIWGIPRPAWLHDELLGAVSILNWGDKEIPISVFSGRWLISANIVYRVDAARSIGGFTEGLGRKEGEVLSHEEFDLHLRLEQKGFQLLYTPAAIVRHHIHQARLTQEALSHLFYCDGISRALMQETGALPRANLGELAKFWTQPAKVRELSLFKDVDSPDAMLAKVKKIADLGLLLSSMAVPALAPPLPSSLSWLRAEPQRIEAASSKPEAGATIYLATPTHNCEAQIDGLVHSVLEQAGDFRIRWHVQDGASTDGTVAKLRDWDRAFKDGRAKPACKGVEFSFASEPDGGMYDAIARAFDRLEVPDACLMTWLNADDRFAPGALAAVQGVGNAFPQVRWLTGVACVIDEKGAVAPQCEQAVYPRDVLSAGLCDLDRWPCPQQEGTFWRGGLYRKAGGVNRSLKLAGDYDLWVRFAEHEDLCLFRGALAYFHLRSGQMSQDLAAYKAEAEGVRPAAARELNWREVREKILARQAGFNEVVLSGDPPVLSLVRHSDLSGYLPRQVRARDRNLQVQLLTGRIEHLAQLFQVSNSRAAPAGSAVQPVAPADRTAEPWAPVPAPPPPAQGFRRIIRALRNLKWYRILSRSGLFLESYYLSRYPDVASAGVDPLYHYLTCGGYEGRSPNPLFDSAYYYGRYPEVAASGVNPLVHYILHGAREGRSPSPEFRVNSSPAKSGGLDAFDGNPLRHYLEGGLLTEK